MALNTEHVVYATKNFLVVTLVVPHIDRKDGGHVVIVSKNANYNALTDLPKDIADELIELAQIVGKAILHTLPQLGIDVKMINYQMNGNWTADKEGRDPLHMHIYGRSRSSVHQKYGEALYLPLPQTGFYDNFTGLTEEDVEELRKSIRKNLK